MNSVFRYYFKIFKGIVSGVETNPKNVYICKDNFNLAVCLSVCVLYYLIIRLYIITGFFYIEQGKWNIFWEWLLTFNITLIEGYYY